MITVHPLTNDPHSAWTQLAEDQVVERVTPLPLVTPIQPNAVRFVCISDTHCRTSDMRHPIPPGDVLLHAGDFTRKGRLEELDEFNNFLGSLPHRHKLVVAGNHELSFDLVTSGYVNGGNISTQRQETSQEAVLHAKRRLTNCTYLQDTQVTACGIKVYGSPWQPRFHNWAFNLPRGRDLLNAWNRIPDDTDVLVTHTPPIGHGDLCVYGTHVGCVELLTVIQRRVRPRYHVFGHIHEDYGMTTDGQTTFINSAICDVNYQPVNAPIIFDLPLPTGMAAKES